MTVTTQAIVFSSIKYGEADLIVTCYTRDYGLKKYMLKGVLKSRKGKLRASYFQPLTQLEIVAIHKNKGTLERIKEVKISVPYQTLQTQVTKSTLALFLSEILKTVIQEEEKNTDLFAFLSHSFVWLDTHNHFANFHILFLLKLSAYLGFYPKLDKTNNQYFNILEGNFQENSTNTYCVSGEKITYFKTFFGINFDATEHIKLTGKVRLEILTLLLSYYQLHLQGFKKPKSVDVLVQIFR